MNKNLHEAFIQLVQLGIGKSKNTTIPENGISWPEIRKLAERHGLYAVVLDGIEKLPATARPPQEFLLEWIGEVLQGYEYRYEQYRRTIAELAGFYNCHGYKMMVVKGYACATNWPKPNHRPCGDIDIWQFGQQKEADVVLEAEKGIEVDSSHHHHTVFNWGEFTVENHYDFLNVHYGHRNDEIETLLKEQAKDDSHSIEIEGQKVYLPNANLHALFVLRHAMHNFAATEMTLRQVLDWAFLVEKHTKEIDWQWLLGILKEYKMMDFFNIINAICVEDLGFSACIFPSVQFLPSLKDRVLADILSPEFSGETPKNFFKRAIFKFRRWQANAWKQEMCYGDNRCKSLIEGVWSHLLKPASI